MDGHKHWQIKFSNGQTNKQKWTKIICIIPSIIISIMASNIKDIEISTWNEMLLRSGSLNDNTSANTDFESGSIQSDL